MGYIHDSGAKNKEEKYKIGCSHLPSSKKCRLTNQTMMAIVFGLQQTFPICLWNQES